MVENVHILRDAACTLATEAGERLLQLFDSGSYDVASKGEANDLVTGADRASEQILIDGVEDRFPTHGILSEERGEIRPDAEVRWLLDPLDGTGNFAQGIPHFSVLLSVQVWEDDRYRTVLGVTYDPTRREFFVAERGRGATRNGRPIRVSRVAEAQDATFATGFSSRRLLLEPAINNHPEFCRMNLLSRGVRRFCSAGLDLAYVACGRFAGFWEAGLGPWDLAGGILMVEEAGGKVSLADGEPVMIDAIPEDRAVVASNGTIHTTMLEVLEDARGRDANVRDNLDQFLRGDLKGRFVQSLTAPHLG